METPTPILYRGRHTQMSILQNLLRSFFVLLTHTRYDDSVNSVAYMIFGPGQAVPKHWSGEKSASLTTSVEPSAKWTVANKLYTAIDGSVGTAFEMGVESGFFLPNELSNTVLEVEQINFYQ